MAKLIFPTPERLLAGFAGLVVFAFLYNLSSQYAAVPQCMRYVPPESVAYVVTARLGTLWNGSTPHLQGYFEGESAHGDGQIRRSALAIKAQLDERDIKPRAAGDLEKLGIAIDGNAALAVVQYADDLHIVIALPVVDQARFVQTFQKVFTEPGAKPTAPAQHRTLTEYTAGSWVLAFGDDGSAVMTDSIGLLRNVLASQTFNLAYFRSSDRQSTGFLKLAAARQGHNDAWVRGALRATSAADFAELSKSPFAFLSDVQFAIGFDAQLARIEARGNLPDVRSDLISRLLAPLGTNTPTGSELLRHSEAALVLADATLPSFLRYIESAIDETSVQSFNAIFPGLLQELHDFTTLTRVGIAPRELSERVPGVIAGLEMSKAEADALVFRLQASLRLKRDREVLQGAIERYRERKASEHDGDERTGPPPVSAGILLAEGLLRPDREALWPRYRRMDVRRQASLNPEPALAPSDFVTAAYVQRRANGVEIHYVMPPVTDDDLDYRLVEGRETIESDELKRDRYRLCSVYVGNTLWLGTDVDVLARWLERLHGAAATSEYAELESIKPGTVGAKVSALALPRQLLDAGQLYPDRNVNQTTRRMLTDFGQYSSALVTLTTRPAEHELDVTATFRR